MIETPVEVEPQTGAASLRASGALGRIGRGMLANASGVGLQVVIQLATVPVLLGAWGVQTYGEWLVLSAIPTYVALSDLSFSDVAGNSMVMLEGAGRRLEAVGLGRHVWSIVTLMTGAAVLAAVVIAFVFAGAFGSQAAIPAPEARIVLGALFVQTAVLNQYGMLDAWYRTGGRYALGVGLRQFGRVLEFGTLVAVVLAGAQPDAAAVAFLLASTLGFAVSLIAVRRAVPWASFRPERPDFQTFRQLLAPGVAFMAFPIGSALSLQGFTIIISATLGVVPVVVFSTTRTMTRAAVQALGVVNNSVWPELSLAVGGQRLHDARLIVQRSMQLTVFACSLVVLTLALSGPAIMRWWTRGAVIPSQELLALLLLVVLTNSSWSTIATVLYATNQHKRLATVYLVTTSMSLLAAIPLSNRMGLSGAAVALVGTEVIMLLYAVPSALRVLKESPLVFMSTVLDLRGAFRAALETLRSIT